MAATAWTVADLAMLTGTALTLALLDSKVYCEWCGVVAIDASEKYCIACADVIADDLAQAYVEQIAVEKGLF